jgi:peptidylprolyl isomerase
MGSHSLGSAAVPTDKRQRQKEGQRARREAAMAATRRQQRKRRVILAVVLAALVAGLLSLLSVAGGDDGEKDDSAASTTTSGKPPTTMPKPTIDVPSGPAPTELEKEDLKVGKGPAAKLGDNIEVNYVGVRYADGEQFDSSWDRNETATFGLTEGGLIDGWVKGIPGMKVGGRRQLIIPSEMAYGDNPQGGRPAGALIFIVDLVAIK